MKYFFIVNVILLQIFFNIASAKTQLESGIKAYDNDDYETAFIALSSTKNENNLQAIFYLGVMYYQGLGNDGDQSLGESLIISSANKGHTEAKIYLAHEYSNGSTSAISRDTALRYLKEASEEGHFYAMYQMGWMFYHGENVDKNLEKAYELFRKSAYSGSVESFYPLALMNYEGTGTSQNYKEAYMWASMAWELYDRDAKSIKDELESKISEFDKEQILESAVKLYAEILTKRK